MMPDQVRTLRARLLILTLVLVSASACSATGPAPSAACGLGGVANEVEFDRRFDSMALEDGTGDPGLPDPDAGVQFSPGDVILVRAAAIEATEVRLCVATRDAQGRIVADVSAELRPGGPTVELGTFDPGSYVVRVGVGDTLVRNLPFAIR